MFVRILLLIFFTLIAILSMSLATGAIGDLKGTFILIFSPGDFTKMTVKKVLEEELKSNTAFKERFEKNDDFRKSELLRYETQFSKSTNKLRGEIWHSFAVVILIVVLSLLAALFFKRWFPLKPAFIQILQIISAFVILWGLLGQLGWSIQTIGGTSLPEQVNSYWFRILNSIGIFLLFFACFYSL